MDKLAVGPGNIILNVQPWWGNVALQHEAIDMVYVVESERSAAPCAGC